MNTLPRTKMVIVGRGSHILLGGLEPVLRLRLFGPQWKRVEIAMQMGEMDRTTAEWLIRKMDHEKACYIQANYGKFPDDPNDFDLMFDISEHSHDQIVTEVCDALRRKDETTSHQARQSRTLWHWRLLSKQRSPQTRAFSSPLWRCEKRAEPSFYWE